MRGENTGALFKGSRRLILQHRSSSTPLTPNPLSARERGNATLRAIELTSTDRRRALQIVEATLRECPPD
jgi:hypothetical protein